MNGTWAEDTNVCAGAGEGMGVQMDGYRKMDRRHGDRAVVDM